MGWRTVVIDSRCLLSCGGGYLEIHKPGKSDMLSRSRVFIGEIETLIIDSAQATITAPVLGALAEAGAGVLFCDSKHLPSLQLMDMNGSYSNKPMRDQLEWSEEIKSLVWQRVVKQKLLSQAGLLKLLKLEKWETLKSLAAETLPADSSNREGHGAKVYFASLFGSGFSRGKEDALNSALNYAYSIILSATARSLASCGYMLQLGINHKGQFNNFNLACDLMEPFRPVADMAVKALMPMELDTKVKHRLADTLNLSVPFLGTVCRLGDAIEEYCRKTARALTEKKPSLVPDMALFEGQGPDMRKYEEAEPSDNE